MTRYLRQLFFLVFALVLRWPVWLLIWLIGRSGLLKGDDAGIHGGADLGDLPAIGHLKTVAGTRCILEGTASGAFVTVGDQFVEGWHDQIGSL